MSGVTLANPNRSWLQSQSREQASTLSIPLLPPGSGTGSGLPLQPWGKGTSTSRLNLIFGISGVRLRAALGLKTYPQQQVPSGQPLVLLRPLGG